MSGGQCCTERVIICQLDSVTLRELIYVSWTYMSVSWIVLH